MAEDGVRSERPLPVVADDGVKRGGVMSDSGAKEGEGSTEEAVQRKNMLILVSNIRSYYYSIN